MLEKVAEINFNEKNNKKQKVEKQRNTSEIHKTIKYIRN